MKYFCNRENFFPPNISNSAIREIPFWQKNLRRFMKNYFRALKTFSVQFISFSSRKQVFTKSCIKRKPCFLPFAKISSRNFFQIQSTAKISFREIYFFRQEQCSFSFTPRGGKWDQMFQLLPPGLPHGPILKVIWQLTGWNLMRNQPFYKMISWHWQQDGHA